MQDAGTRVTRSGLRAHAARTQGSCKFAGRIAGKFARSKNCAAKQAIQAKQGKQANLAGASRGEKQRAKLINLKVVGTLRRAAT
jgi:hypothetical protein